MIAFLDASALIDLVDGEPQWAEATQVTLQQLAVEALLSHWLSAV